MSETNEQQYDAIALLSGGLDSILAVKVVQEQGLKVKCLHFVTPFFGKPREVERWETMYGLDIDVVDVSEDFVTMMRERPTHGYGKVLNPCVDCKILMMRKTRELMPKYGAKFIISGEVVGQRPMSQRRDTLNVIRRDAEVRDVLVRPLCAKRLDPTEAEEKGWIDREQLLSISGRGRKEQLALAEKYQLPVIPTPAGGCKLAERENARRYWPVLDRLPDPKARDFKLANVGRQYWSGNRWLSIGRNKGDNEGLRKLARKGDLLFKVVDFPGPIAVGRQIDEDPWSPEEVAHAAAFVASFSPKAVRSGELVQVELSSNGHTGFMTVMPDRETPMKWAENDWLDVREDIKVKARKLYNE
ncbi:tRNA(5-methylaminomethyl-2-thiouridylate) methyltransferase [Oleidesulfovibrio sp.]|uniref:tRNA(5-methylaminomethyl-2-thiouridylate) methyltransferase n=1 Tax=Oleidesulfovibrio sp. TaxID=2909707 RepID=UPI003A8A00B4